MTDIPKLPDLKPPFDRMTDPIAAVAFNDLFTSGAYKVELSESYPLEPDAPNSGFPPEPLELLSITGAYFHPLEGLAKGYTPLSDNLPSKRQTLGLYKSTVSNLHQSMPQLLEVTQHMPGLATKDQLQERALDMVQGVGNLVMAAHIIARLNRNGALVDALALPTAVSDGITMEMRHFITPYLAELSADDPLHEWLKRGVQGHNREAASITAASFLPDIRVMQRAVPSGTKKNGPA